MHGLFFFCATSPLTKFLSLCAQGRDSVPAWKGTDLKDRVLEEDVQFVQHIIEQELGGVIRMLSPRVQNDLADGDGTYVEIWLPAVPNFDDL